MAQDQKGTGKHGHKDTEEPWPHHGQGSGSQSEQGGSSSRKSGGSKTSGSGGGSKTSGSGGGSKASGSGSGGSRSSGGEDPSLKQREYRDKDGEVHHHTRTYQEQHGKK
jgi:hypothetical protein